MVNEHAFLVPSHYFLYLYTFSNSPYQCSKVLNYRSIQNICALLNQPSSTQISKPYSQLLGKQCIIITDVKSKVKVR